MSEPPVFPSAQWDDLHVTFQPFPLPNAGARPFAVVVFARSGDSFVLADIPDRGWITPSGRIELGESAREAAIRETWEEVGGLLEEPHEIGYYEMRSEDGVIRRAVAFVGHVREFGAIPPESESRGARLASLDELPGLYWRWDALLEAMFGFANSQIPFSQPLDETS